MSCDLNPNVGGKGNFLQRGFVSFLRLLLPTRGNGVKCETEQSHEGIGAAGCSVVLLTFITVPEILVKAWMRR